MAAETPLQPEAFFAGRWEGQGQLRPARFLRWLQPVQHVRLSSVTVPLAPGGWRVEETFAFSGGAAIERTMLVEIAAPDRLRVKADDMPGGAEVLLSASGFAFEPYTIVVRRFGLKLRLRCRDVNSIEADGTIHDLISMSLLGLPVATMELRVVRNPG